MDLLTITKWTLDSNWPCDYMWFVETDLRFFSQTSYESGIKELSAEFRVRLQEELTQREAVEKQLEKQVIKEYSCRKIHLINSIKP